MPHGSRSLVRPIVAGMALNVASIAIGNPYFVSAIGLVAAVAAVLMWRNRPLTWIAFTSVLAANPVNLSASISLNLICAAALLVVEMKRIRKLPPFLLLGTTFALLSAGASAIGWRAGVTPESFFTQGAAVANYIVGPAILIPFGYAHLRREDPSSSLVGVLLYALILPTVAMLIAAHTFGEPLSAFTAVQEQFGAVDVTIYQLGNVAFTFTRTQVGIVLAAVVAGAFAVVLAARSRRSRVVAGICMASATALLMVTGSVGSALAIAAAAAAILVVAKRRIGARRFAAAFVAATIIVGAAAVAMPDNVQRYVASRYEERFSSGVDVSDREAKWRAAFEYLMDNPVGEGWGLFIERLGTYPHNDYLSYGIAFGILCGVLYAALVAAAIALSALRGIVVADPDRLASVLAGVGAGVVCLVNSFADHLTANRWYFNVVWSMIWFGFFAAQRTPGDEAKSVPVVPG